MKRLIGIPVLLCAVVAIGLGGCGGSDDSSESDAAVESLKLSIAVGDLQSETGKVVKSLGTDLSSKERRAVQRRLSTLQRQAARLVASADTDSTFQVKLRPINGSKARGSATLVASRGKVAVKGGFAGMTANRRHPVTVNALRKGEGSSICPPANAAGGGDSLSASEAEDFYGRPAMRLGAVDSANVTLASSGPARSSAPLNARTVILSGGKAKDGYEGDLPVACGVPTIAPVDSTVAAPVQIVAAANSIRAAGLELSTVNRDPVSKRAVRARASAAARLRIANVQLAKANRKIRTELESGDVSDAELKSLDRTVKQLEGSGASVTVAFHKLKQGVDHAIRQAQRRKAQRRAAQKAAREAAAAAAAAAAATPAPTEVVPVAPTYSAPAPAPAPSAPSGPVIPAPG